jgi:hypothetical protein
MRMPVFWALTQGFILKAVGPAVIIPTMLDLQKKGLGVNKGGFVSSQPRKKGFDNLHDMSLGGIARLIPITKTGPETIP